MNNRKLFSILVSVLCVFLVPIMFQINIAYAQGPECCDRHGIITSCNSNDPMQIIGSHSESHDAYCRSIKTSLAQLMVDNCFHLLNEEFVNAYRQNANQEGWASIVKPSNVPEHEYSFETEFVSGLNEFNDEGRPIRSRLTVKLYFEGEQRELIHTWQTQGTWDTISNSGTTWLGHVMKLNSAYKSGPDIIEIIERFEKRPVDFNINPERNDLDAGEIIDFDLTEFKDIFGEASREFNRIVVHAYEGDILNGDPCNIGPDYRVFKLNNGSVKVKYRAPSDCNVSSDRFTVYSSCDILPNSRVPIVETQIKERIFEKEFAINCYDAKLNISGKYEKIIKTSKKDTKDGSVDNHSLNESLEVSVSIFLEFIQAEDMPIFYQTFQYYKPTSVSITGFTYNSEENRYMSGPAFETNINFNRTASKQKIDGKEYLSQVPWVLVIDNETKKAVKLIHAGYGISYEVLESEIMNSVNYSTNVPQRKSETTTKTSSKSFSLGPVGEKVQDPTIKRSDTWVQDYLKKQGVEIPAGVPIPKIPNQADQQEIYPDILVKYGDGKTSFGGEGRRPIKEEIEDGYQEENLHYSWNMTVKKKK